MASEQPNIDRLAEDILGALPRSVDDPEWESPTAVKVRELVTLVRDTAEKNRKLSKLVMEAESDMRKAKRAQEAAEERVAGLEAALRKAWDHLEELAGLVEDGGRA